MFVFVQTSFFFFFSYLHRCLQKHMSVWQTWGDSIARSLDENSSTFLPAMPLISWIRPQKITALPQTAFVPTLALTKLRTAAVHIFQD